MFQNLRNKIAGSLLSLVYKHVCNHKLQALLAIRQTNLLGLSQWGPLRKARKRNPNERMFREEEREQGAYAVIEAKRVFSIQGENSHYY